MLLYIPWFKTLKTSAINFADAIGYEGEHETNTGLGLGLFNTIGF